VLLLIPLQLPVILLGHELQLAAAEVDLDVGKLHQEQFILVAGLQVRALIAVAQTPALGTDPDGAVLQASPVHAAGAFRVGQKPLQPLPELRHAKTVRPGKAVKPDVGPDPVQIFLEPGDRFQETGVAQLAIITQTAITFSHGLSPKSSLWLSAFSNQL
jgi:hypothetical protein